MLAGYRCPPGGEAPGRANTIEYCLGQCTKQCVAPPLLAAMYKADTENYHNDTSYLSASMLAGSNCARQTLWERSEDFWDLPRKRYWPFRGTHAHSICERAEGLIDRFGWLQELRTSVVFDFPDKPAPIFETVVQDNGEIVSKFTGKFDHSKILQITVKGTADAYNPLTRQLADMKSMADSKATMVINGTKGGTFSKNLEDSHVWQFNIYRLLLARTAIPQGIKDKFKEFGLPAIKGKTFPAPTELIMQGIGMMDIPRSGGTYYTAKYGKTTLHDIDPVPVLPLTEIEAYVREKALFWHRHLILGYPTKVLPKDKAWMCKNCAFNGDLIDGERCHPEAERAEMEAAND